MSETHRPYSYACHRRQAVARVGVSVRPGRQQVAASIVRVGHRRGGASRAGQTAGVVIGEAFRRSYRRHGKAPTLVIVYWALPETVEFRLDAVPVILPFGIPHR